MEAFGQLLCGIQLAVTNSYFSAPYLSCIASKEEGTGQFGKFQEVTEKLHYMAKKTKIIP